MKSVRAAIGIGSNLGSRLTHLELALQGLGASVEVQACSVIYETEPMHLVDQPPFLNACCVGHTELTARSLLESFQDLERRAGRRSGGPRFGPRELDIDLLLYGDVVIEETDLQVPHPRMAERPFVLWPLAEIAGDWTHPVTGRTISEMAAKLPRDSLRPHAAPTEWTEIGS